MKLPITELVEDCAVEGLDLGTPDAAMTARVQARVLGEIAGQNRRRLRKLRRTARLTLLIAAVLALFGGAAYAGNWFSVKAAPLQSDEHSPGYWIFQDSQGNELSYKLFEPFEEGLCFSFQGGSEPHRVEFRPNWLPQEPTFWYPQREDGPLDTLTPGWEPESGDWFTYLLDDRQSETDFLPEPGVMDVGIPYLITVDYCAPGRVLWLNGRGQIVKQELWGALEVYEVSCAKEIRLRDGTVYSYENYVLLFSREEGYVVNVGGTLELETLEHIARELELRVLDPIATPTPRFSENSLNIVLG